MHSQYTFLVDVSRPLRGELGTHDYEPQKIWNEEIGANKSEKIREARLRWLGLVARKTDEDVMRT